MGAARLVLSVNIERGIETSENIFTRSMLDSQPILPTSFMPP